MKKIYLSLLSAVFGLSVNAQTLTQANHAPSNGDLFDTYQCDSAAINPGAAGAGSTWNFGSITTHSNIVTSYTVSTVANATYPNADIAVYSSTNNISYFKSNASSLKYYGGNISVGGITATLNFTAPALYAAYPMSLNTSTSTTTSGTLDVSTQPGTFVGTSDAIADGTGTLIVPGATYTNAIRVVTSQVINYTVSIITGTVTQINYEYYAAGVKQPVFTISTATMASSFGAPSTQTIVTRLKSSTVGIEKNSAETIDLSVFPNPSNSVVNFVTPAKNAIIVTVFDINGKLVDKQNLNEGSLKLDVSSYAAGIYTYKISGNHNEVLTAGKFNVVH